MLNGRQRTFFLCFAWLRHISPIEQEKKKERGKNLKENENAKKEEKKEEEFGWFILPKKTRSTDLCSNEIVNPKYLELFAQGQL